MRGKHFGTVDSGAALGFFIILTTAFFSVAAWSTHVVWAIAVLASDRGGTFEQAVVGIGGVIFPPFGIVHGVMLWCGA